MSGLLALENCPAFLELLAIDLAAGVAFLESLHRPVGLPVGLISPVGAERAHRPDRQGDQRAPEHDHRESHQEPARPAPCPPTPCVPHHLVLLSRTHIPYRGRVYRQEGAGLPATPWPGPERFRGQLPIPRACRGPPRLVPRAGRGGPP